jgi:hypothetical protein
VPCLALITPRPVTGAPSFAPTADPLLREAVGAGGAVSMADPGGFLRGLADRHHHAPHAAPPVPVDPGYANHRVAGNACHATAFAVP